jgi:hypothetical protein
MNPIILPIIQFAITYGIPAAMELVKLFQKKEITVADWEAVFALAETPYGLTPQIVSTGPAVIPTAIKVGEVKRYPDTTIIGLCELPPSVKCWDVKKADMRQLANSYIWTVGGMYFQMPADFKP